MYIYIYINIYIYIFILFLDPFLFYIFIFYNSYFLCCIINLACSVDRKTILLVLHKFKTQRTIKLRSNCKLDMLPDKLTSRRNKYLAFAC